MCIDYLAKVVELANVARPTEQPNLSHWNALEAELGAKMPRDYKNLVTRLGSGRFGELVLLNPMSSSPYTCLTAPGMLEYNKSIEWIAEEGAVRLFPQDPGFVRVGSTGFGYILLVEISTSGEIPDKLNWFNLDAWSGRGLAMSVSQFLHDLYIGLLPEAWAKEQRHMIWWNAWGPDEPFFRSDSTPYEGGNITCLNG